MNASIRLPIEGFVALARTVDEAFTSMARNEFNIEESGRKGQPDRDDT
jgi:hypothetical protein